MLGYACCTRVGQYLIAAYKQEVQKNLEVQAQQRLEKQAAAEAQGLQGAASAAAAPARRPSRPKVVKQQRNRNTVAAAARPAQAKATKPQQQSSHIPDPPQPAEERVRALHQNIMALLRAEQEAHQGACRDVLQFVASVDFDAQSKEGKQAGAEGGNYHGEIDQVYVDCAPLIGLEDEEGAVGGSTTMSAELCQAMLHMLEDTEEILRIHYKDSAGCMQTETLFAATPSRDKQYPSADQEDGLKSDALPMQERPDPSELRAGVVQLIKTKILESTSERNFEKKHEEVHQRHLREQNLSVAGEEQHHFSLQVVGFKPESTQPPSESESEDTSKPITNNSAADVHSVKSASDAGIVAAKIQELKNLKGFDRKHT